MPNLPERPFFIVGHPRSGTTLLRFMLSSHPRLFIPEETGFIPFLVKQNRIDTSMSYKDVSNMLQRIGKLNYMWKDKVREVPTFYKSLPEPKLAYMLDEIFRNYTTDEMVYRWGDKTPLYIQYIPVLNKIFPEAQFIHLIRDGRDAAISARNKWPENSSYMDLVYLLRNWVLNTNAGRKAGSWLGNERYYEIFYETLVSEPQETLKDLCKFLHEEFHSAMLDHTILASNIGPGPAGHVEVLKPVSTSSVGRWKERMTPFEKKCSDQIAGTTLSNLGYELANLGPLSVKERLQYLALNAKFFAADKLRRMLYAFGILTLNRTMRKE